MMKKMRQFFEIIFYALFQ